MIKRYPWTWLPIFVFLSGCATVEIRTEVQAGRTALLKGEPDTARAHFEAAAQSNPDDVADFTRLPQGVWTYVGRSYYAAGKLPEARQALERARSRHKDDFLAKLYLGLTLIRQQTQQAKMENPLSLEDILYALKEGVAPKRVVTLIQERGIGFKLTNKGEKSLRSGGADDQLVQEIKVISSQTGKTILRERGLEEAQAGLKDLHSWLESITEGTLSGRFWDPEEKIHKKIQATLSLTSAKDIDWEKLLAGGEWVGKAIEEESDRAREDEAQQRRTLGF